jgi:hypothetical protein
MDWRGPCPGSYTTAPPFLLYVLTTHACSPSPEPPENQRDPREALKNRETREAGEAVDAGLRGDGAP